MHWMTRLNKCIDRWEESLPLKRAICKPRPFITRTRKKMMLRAPSFIFGAKSGLYVAEVLDESRMRMIEKAEKLMYKSVKRKSKNRNE